MTPQNTYRLRLREMYGKDIASLAYADWLERRLSSIEGANHARNAILEAYVDQFRAKNGFDTHFWFDDMDYVAVGDISLNIEHVMFDIDTNQPPGRIIEWYNHPDSVDYPDYCKGLDEAKANQAATPQPQELPQNPPK